MKNLQAILLIDFYKSGHADQYEKGTEYVYSTWTDRASLIPGITGAVTAGQQKVCKEYLIDFFNENFFSKPKEKILSEYKRMLKFTLGAEPNTTRIEELYDLGYLPISIKSLPEGTICPVRVPMMTIENTNPKFYWLTNYLETLLSCELWSMSTSATIAHQYKKLLTQYAKETGGDLGFINFQGHDFSMRGMTSLQSSVNSGLGHLMSFAGTDTIPAIMAAEEFYNANVEKELVGCSVPATEHAVMCANGADEAETIRRLMKVYPTGILSVVSDTWDFWNLVGNILPVLKDEIMTRDGKLVIRPDSGDPVKIICGDITASYSNPHAIKGLIESLWDTFGGTVNAAGYKVLDSHIGAIYGDSITLTRAAQICEGLKAKGFASTNIVFGIGSFTYQYNTRDTFGFAMKATSVTINGDEKQIFKNPKTDSGIKKSQKGRVIVFKEEGSEEIKFLDNLTSDDVEEYSNINMHKEIFRDGKLLVDDTFANIRARLDSQV